VALLLRAEVVLSDLKSRAAIFARLGPIGTLFLPKARHAMLQTDVWGERMSEVLEVVSRMVV
jgi:hypothetical protein